MRRFITLLLAIGALAAAAAAPVSASSIEFEYLLGDNVTLQQLQCDPSGTSSATLFVTGTAGGPHPGTFESTITLTAGAFTTDHAPLVEVNESFEIASGDTVVTGTKHLIPVDPAGAFYRFSCSVTSSAECEEVSLFADASGDALRYEATITGPEGTRQVEGYAEFHVNADGFRCGGVMQFSSGYFEQFFTAALPAQEPASVTLSPATATNPVDTFHEVTATVLDESGQPVSGAVVRFNVDGASSASGDCRSDGNGGCAFSYQVAPFPGEDTIAAYVDVNADGVHDSGEPAATATKTIGFPTSAAGRTTGDGKFVKNQTGATGDVKFEVAFRSDGTTLRGQCSFIDKATGTTIKCLDVLAYIQHGTHVLIYGHAEQNGVPTLYRIEIDDNGVRVDEVTIITAAGYAASGSVTSGDIQVR